MQTRTIGNSELSTAPLVFGGNVFGWTIDQPASFQLLDAFTDAGFNCIDTADVYSRWVPGNSGGESETIIGNWMKAKNNRDKLVIATKVGGDMGSGKRDTSRAYILKAVEDSLKRLQTDYIDLYQTHWDDPATPVEETLEAYAQLIREGKVRYIGASNLSAERLTESIEAAEKNGYPSYQSFQPLYNLYDREPFEKELQSVCMSNNIGVITYFSLASGFLTGKYKSASDLSQSKRGAFMTKYFTERGVKILAALNQVSKTYTVSPAAVSIAWLLAQPAVTAPIASATSIAQLRELLHATELRLDKESLDILTQASAW